MRISTTDGKKYFIPDGCGYCRMDTAGNHESRCPCYREKWKIKIIETDVDFDKETSFRGIVK